MSRLSTRHSMSGTTGRERARTDDDAGRLRRLARDSRRPRRRPFSWCDHALTSPFRVNVGGPEREARGGSSHRPPRHALTAGAR
jgi:hypothetical protein